MEYGSFLTDDLFEKVLVEPVIRGATELYIVTGYASSAMVTRHFEEITKTQQRELSIDLHVGMSGRDGLSRRTLLGLQAIPRQIGSRTFNCTFSSRGSSIHSKLYVWCDDSGPREAFLGSSNYTQLGFGIGASSQTHGEVCTPIDPELGFKYVLRSSKDGIGYKSDDVFEYIDLIDDALHNQRDKEDSEDIGLLESPSVDLPLVMLRGADAGQVHTRSALNWGQREGRNPNQAYIPVPSAIARTGFFPERGQHFQVSTDDGEAFICTIAQEGDKAIETPSDNSLIGLYFRRVLGLRPGDPVSTEDLERFGSNAVRFTKIDSETYQLSFMPGLVIDPASF